MKYYKEALLLTPRLQMTPKTPKSRAKILPSALGLERKLWEQVEVQIPK